MCYRNNPLMEPEFFTPPGSKRLYKGGGSGTPYYANQDKLFGTQFRFLSMAGGASIEEPAVDVGEVRGADVTHEARQVRAE